jgi:hypothetical protein
MATNPNKAFLTGTDSVLQWYDTNAKTPYWSVRDAKGDILFFYAGKDENESRQHLEDNMRMAEAQGVEATLTLKIHPRCPKEGYFGKNEEGIVITHFRPSSYNPTSYQPVNSFANDQLLNELRAMRSELAAIKMKQEMEEAEEFEDDEPEEENALMGFMKNPAIQNMLIAQISNLFNPNQKVTHVAGVMDGAEAEVESDEDDKIDQAIEVLKQYDDQLGDDLLLLSDMAEKDPMQFKFLLKMLRK